MNEISTAELEDKMEARESLHIIDVREDEEVAAGMIPGAIHIRLGDIPKRLDELDKGKHYYMVCRSGGRSGNASEYLEAKGYQATNVAGGMLDWHGDVEIAE